MATETKSAEISTVLGVEQKVPIKFSYTFETFESPQSVRDSGEWPNDKEVLEYVNGKRERNALSSARAVAQKDAVELISKTVEYRRQAFVANGMKQGFTDRAMLEAIAEQNIK